MGKVRPASHRAAVALIAALAFLLVALPGAATADSVATTNEPSNVTTSSAMLNGTATPNHPQSFYYFQYGTSTHYGSRTPEHNQRLSGDPGQHVSATATGLMPGTTYHYRLVVVSSYTPTTQTHFGGDVTFTTPTNFPATTGQATDITTTSAWLNGVTNTAEPATWFFEYGTTTAYGHQTPTQTTTSGVNLVAARVTGLAPRTRYHFRLVVLQPFITPKPGADSSFVTLHPAGRAVLRSHRLRVRHGRAAVPFACKGQSGDPCVAKVTLQTRGKLGKRTRTVSCGKAMLKTTAPRKPTLHPKVGSGCSKLLRNAKHHRIRATLKATFSTKQRAIRRTVTLHT